MHTPLNNAFTTLANAHSIGDGQLDCVDASVFGTPSPSAPVRVSATVGGVEVIFSVNGIATNVLSIDSAIEGTFDMNLPAGTLIENRHTAGSMIEIHDAIDAIDAQLDAFDTDLDTKADDASVVHLTGDETIAGSKTFSSTVIASINGNAATVTNGVYTTGSYSDPTWLTAIAGSKVSGNISGNAANVTGTVAIANGGTGQTTANAAFNALAPSQASNSGKFLTTDGTDTSWATVSASPGGSSGQVQYNNGGSFAGDAGHTYDASTDTVSIIGAADGKRLILKAHSTQTNRLFEVQNSSGQARAYLDSSYNFTTRGAPTNGAAVGGYVMIGQWSGSDRTAGMQFDNSAVDPFLWITNSANTIYMIGTAIYFGATGPFVLRSTETYNDQGGGCIFSSLNSGHPAIVVRQRSGQSANMINFQNSSNTVVAAFRNDFSWDMPVLADSSAANDSFYYSSTGSAPAYKNSSGSVSYMGSVSTSGQTLDVFTALDSIAPATDWAAADVVNRHPVLNFNDSTDQSTFFESCLRRSYGNGGIKVRLTWLSTASNSGDVVWNAAFEALDAGQDITSDSFDTAQAATATVHGTTGRTVNTDITFTNSQIDSIAAGSNYRLKVTRDANNGSDTMVGDAKLLRVELRET